MLKKQNLTHPKAAKLATLRSEVTEVEQDQFFVCLFDVKSLDKARQLLLGNYHRYLV